MKTTKPLHFYLSCGLVLLAFVLLLVWWLLFILNSFQAINNTQGDSNVGGFKKVNMDAYYNLYPGDKPK